MRAFTIESQRSSASVDSLVVAPWNDRDRRQSAMLSIISPANATVVLDEPATIAAVAAALDEERARERHTLLAATDRGEALLAGRSSAPPASLAELGRHASRSSRRSCFPAQSKACSVASIGCRAVLDSFVFECRPVEHFNRQI